MGRSNMPGERQRLFSTVYRQKIDAFYTSACKSPSESFRYSLCVARLDRDSAPAAQKEQGRRRFLNPNLILCWSSVKRTVGVRRSRVPRYRRRPIWNYQVAIATGLKKKTRNPRSGSPRRCTNNTGYDGNSDGLLSLRRTLLVNAGPQRRNPPGLIDSILLRSQPKQSL